MARSPGGARDEHCTHAHLLPYLVSSVYCTHRGFVLFLDGLTKPTIWPTGCHVSPSGSISDSLFDEGLLEARPQPATNSTACDERPGENSHEV